MSKVRRTESAVNKDAILRILAPLLDRPMHRTLNLRRPRPSRIPNRHTQIRKLVHARIPRQLASAIDHAFQARRYMAVKRRPPSDEQPGLDLREHGLLSQNAPAMDIRFQSEQVRVENRIRPPRKRAVGVLPEQLRVVPPRVRGKGRSKPYKGAVEHGKGNILRRPRVMKRGAGRQSHCGRQSCIKREPHRSALLQHKLASLRNQGWSEIRVWSSRLLQIPLKMRSNSCCCVFLSRFGICKGSSRALRSKCVQLREWRRVCHLARPGPLDGRGGSASWQDLRGSVEVSMSTCAAKSSPPVTNGNGKGNYT